MNPVIAADDVSLHYRRGSETVRALDRVSLTLVGGELVALRGPSGSGKTSLLSLLCGWESPKTGRIAWKGLPGVKLEALLWNEIAIIPQSLALLEELTIGENIGLPRRLAPTTRSGHGWPPADVLDRLGLGGLEDRYPAEVSLGEQQRAAVARGVARQPTLLLADEPTAHQDSEAARKVLEIFAETAERGGCCLMATHDPEAVRFADRVIDLEKP